MEKETLPGVYGVEKIGEENLDHFLYNVALPNLKKKFGIKKNLNKDLLGTKISKAHGTSGYDRESRTITLHPEMLYADTIGEELTHYLVDSEKGEIGRDTHEFYGMLGRLGLYDELKNTKYARLFREGFDKSLDAERVKYAINLASNQTEKERESSTIINKEDRDPLSIMPDSSEFGLEFYKDLKSTFSPSSSPRNLSETHDLEGIFDKYKQKVKDKRKYYQKLLNEAKKELGIIRSQERSEEKEFKDSHEGKYRPGTYGDIWYKLNLKNIKKNRKINHIKQKEMLDIISSYVESYGEILDKIGKNGEKIEKVAEESEMEELWRDYKLKHKQNLDSNKLHTVKGALKKIEEAYKRNDEKKAKEIISEFRLDINGDLEIYEEIYRRAKEVQKTPENSKKGPKGPKITPKDILACSVLHHKEGYDAGLKAYKEIKEGNLGYQDIFEMDEKGIKKRFF